MAWRFSKGIEKLYGGPTDNLPSAGAVNRVNTGLFLSNPHRSFGDKSSRGFTPGGGNGTRDFTKIGVPGVNPIMYTR